MVRLLCLRVNDESIEVVLWIYLINCVKVVEF